MERRLNILIANSGRKWIGEVAHCVALAEALRARGDRVWVACRAGSELERRLGLAEERRGDRSKQRDAEKDNEKENEKDRNREGPTEGAGGGVVFRFSSRFSVAGDLKDILQMRRFLIREGIDVLHVHRGKDHWIGIFAAKLAGLPVVRTRHVVVPIKRHLFNWWLLTRATAALLSVSRAAEASMGRFAQSVARRRVILSAVDANKFNPAHRSEAWRRGQAVAPCEGEPIWIGLIGRFQNVKGQEYFLRAARIVAERVPDARFVIAGAGAQRKRRRYLSLAEELGIKEKVIVEGHLENLPEVMASLDIGAVASIGSEGSSRVTLEFMASGAAVVATRVGGIPDAIEPAGRAAVGRLVPPRDPEAMAAALIELALDASARRAQAEAARAAAVELHDPAAWAAEIESVYREAIGSDRLGG